MTKLAPTESQNPYLGDMNLQNLIGGFLVFIGEGISKHFMHKHYTHFGARVMKFTIFTIYNSSYPQRCIILNFKRLGHVVFKKFKNVQLLTLGITMQLQ